MESKGQFKGGEVSDKGPWLRQLGLGNLSVGRADRPSRKLAIWSVLRAIQSWATCNCIFTPLEAGSWKVVRLSHSPLWKRPLQMKKARSKYKSGIGSAMHTTSRYASPDPGFSMLKFSESPNVNHLAVAKHRRRNVVLAFT